jgi:hypothetical protein
MGVLLVKNELKLYKNLRCCPEFFGSIRETTQNLISVAKIRTGTYRIGSSRATPLDCDILWPHKHTTMHRVERAVGKEE